MALSPSLFNSYFYMYNRSDTTNQLFQNHLHYMAITGDRFRHVPQSCTNMHPRQLNGSSSHWCCCRPRTHSHTPTQASLPHQFLQAWGVHQCFAATELILSQLS